MTDYTVDEVLEAIRNAYREDPEDEYVDISEFWYDGGTLTLRGESVEPVEVDSTGGMDEGSNASVTFKVGDQYFRKSGYYASHYGYDWDGEFEEVHPVEKTVTVYEPR